jgi:putative phosphoesterase
VSAEHAQGAPVRVGIVSDTHGVLPLTAFPVLAGVDAIVHAGDACTAEVLYLLETIAPVTAVRGNCDTARGVRDLPAVANVMLGGVRIVVVHMLPDAPHDPEARVVISGHTHIAKVEERDGVLYVNPGSATQSREARATVALLTIEAGGAVSAKIVELDDELE